MDHGSFLIRSAVRNKDVVFRGEGVSPDRLKSIRSVLRTLHNLEIMAVHIYRFQISGARAGHDRQLIAAVMNEMTHVQDFQIKLYEYGFRPSSFRWAHRLAGTAVGTVSRLMGRAAALRTGIWVERKAVSHYGELIRKIEWDEATAALVKKNRRDEEEHIRVWNDILEMTARGKARGDSCSVSSRRCRPRPGHRNGQTP
jgi:demethoxyubiquinone hydroxylase (CLK1/Coq7/Cat5 family)